MIGLLPRHNPRWTTRIIQNERTHSHLRNRIPPYICRAIAHRSQSKANAFGYITPLYVDSLHPTNPQCQAAWKFFASHTPQKSWTASEWRKQPHSESTSLTPEIVFLGRSNSGKSSLINALLNDADLCRVGPKPGKTAVMHAWSLSPIPPKTISEKKRFPGDLSPKLTVLDMPGYGHGSHSEWGRDILKYLTRRRQLRRAFVLINSLHGLKQSDLQTLALLRENGIAHQLIASKCDMVQPNELQGSLEAVVKSVEQHFGQKEERIALITIRDVLAVGKLGDGRSNSRVDYSRTPGLNHVRWAILRAAGLEDYAMALVEGISAASPQMSVLPTSMEQQSGMAKRNPNVNSARLIQDPKDPSDRPKPAIPSTSKGQPLVSTRVEDQAKSVGIGMSDLTSMLGVENNPASSEATSSQATTSKSSTRTLHQRRQLRRRTMRASV